MHATWEAYASKVRSGGRSRLPSVDVVTAVALFTGLWCRRRRLASFAAISRERREVVAVEMKEEERGRRGEGGRREVELVGELRACEAYLIKGDQRGSTPVREYACTYRASEQEQV